MIQTLNLAMLVQQCGTITGRKKLQKIVHLLQVAGFRRDFSYDFGYLHYGPYSHGVKNDLEILVREQLVDENETNAGEHATYQYSASPSLAEDLQAVGVSLDTAWSRTAQNLNQLSPQQLEAASTIAYLQDKGFSADALRTKFQDLKPALANHFDFAKQKVVELRSRETL